ncbi:MAG: L-fucose/L-arabinose isomerase family protein [Desulfocapsaceae bacterium]|jgi:L-fucose isomerase-like protein|nr:L-fucose/L-arabinose isomerase family protein [Desulfocapsaceae bacterium]
MKTIKPRIGVLAVGRNTFDVSYAQEIQAEALQALKGLDIDLVGTAELLFDAEQITQALAALQSEHLDMVLLLQVTFTDAAMTMEIARQLDAPLVMWSFPEPRTGGRLRLNSLCGINLAAHALSRVHLSYDFVHGKPSDENVVSRIHDFARAAAVRQSLRDVRIGVIGRHPDGFDACMFSHNECRELFGVEIEEHDLIEFLDSVKELDDSVALPHYEDRRQVMVNLADMDREVTLKTLKAYEGMRRLISRRNYAGLAVRCWPEFFTHYGAAACGAIALLNEHFIPGGCEADVHGVITSLILQRLAGEPAFNTDLVDIDPETDTCVFWHCGQAPVQMADPEVPIKATIHSNRKLPLLNEFPLKPGRFTMARLSKGHDKTTMIIGAGEMLRAPLAFSGTSGVARLDSPANEVLENLMRAGLEHHTAIVYGEHRPALRILAGHLNLGVVELTR